MSEEKKLCHLCRQSILASHRRDSHCTFTGEPRKAWVVRYIMPLEKTYWAVKKVSGVVWTEAPWLATTFSHWVEARDFVTARRLSKPVGLLEISLLTEDFLDFCAAQKKSVPADLGAPVPDEALFAKPETSRENSSVYKAWAPLLKKLEDLGKEHPKPSDEESIKTLRDIESLDELIEHIGPASKEILALFPPEKFREASIRFEYRKHVRVGLERILDDIDVLGTMCDFTFDRAVQNKLKEIRFHLGVALDGEPRVGTRVDCAKVLDDLNKLLDPEPAAGAPFDPEAGLPEWDVHYFEAAAAAGLKDVFKDYGVIRALSMERAVDKVIDLVHPQVNTGKDVAANVRTAQLRSEMRRHLIVKPHVKG